MRNKNQLKAGAILSYISLGITSFISIIYTPIMLRLLGQSQYGLYNLANSVIGYLGVLDFGLGNAVVRYTSKYRALNDKESEENLYGMFIIIYSILAIIILIAGGILVVNSGYIFSAKLSISELKTMKVLMGIMIFNLAISFPLGIFGAIITAYERFIFPKIVSIIRAVINPFIMLPLLLMGYTSIGLTVATTILNIIFMFINIYYCFFKLKIKIQFKKIRFNVIREISGYSFFVFMNIIVDKIYWSTDQLILGAVSGSIAVAIYAVASTINGYYMNFSTAISGVFLPKITAMVTRSVSDKEISDLFIRTGRVQYIIMSFILGGFILVGQQFINTWAGQGYRQAYYIAIIVMIPLTIPLIQTLGISILQAKNMHKFRSIIYLIISLINLIASIPLAKILGGTGAAIATAVSMVLGHGIIMNIYYMKIIKLDILSFWNNILKMSIPVVLSLVVSKFINSSIYINGYLGVAIQAIIFSFIFLVFMWFIGMNDYEKQLLCKPFEKIRNKMMKRVNIKIN